MILCYCMCCYAEAIAHYYIDTRDELDVGSSDGKSLPYKSQAKRKGLGLFDFWTV